MITTLFAELDLSTVTVSSLIFGAIYLAISQIMVPGFKFLLEKASHGEGKTDAPNHGHGKGGASSNRNGVSTSEFAVVKATVERLDRELQGIREGLPILRGQVSGAKDLLDKIWDRLE